jgi:DNA (cytosine-5)-methyltransferase 1
MNTRVPVIDLFAGPGGLSEGFTVTECNGIKFEVVLSCELDSVACDTLRLRKFFHLARQRGCEKDYYTALKTEAPDRYLSQLHPGIWQEAASRVLQVELGSEDTKLTVHTKIREAINWPNSEFVLIGGPPCQAYSLVGRSRRLGPGSSATNDAESSSRKREELAKAFYSDPKHRLYREYLEIIALHKPAVFVMENVKGLASARTSSEPDAKSMFERIVGDLTAPGAALRDQIRSDLVTMFGFDSDLKYRLVALSDEGSQSTKMFDSRRLQASDFVIKCERYGIPQKRHRVIIVGIREDISPNPALLRESEPVSAQEILASLPRLRSALSKSSNDWQTWFSAIQNEVFKRFPMKHDDPLGIQNALPKLQASTQKLTTGSVWTSIPSPVMSNAAVANWLNDFELSGVSQHESRSHMSSDLVRYLYCALFAERHGFSPKLEQWPVALKPAHQNVADDGYALKATAFSDRFKVQGSVDRSTNAGLPSSTITSHIAKDGHYYIHFDPLQCRSLTVREAARLQTFPDNYYFCGNRTQQYHQIGNAVPPFLALQIAECVATAVHSLVTKKSAELSI